MHAFGPAVDTEVLQPGAFSFEGEYPIVRECSDLLNVVLLGYKRRADPMNAFRVAPTQAPLKIVREGSGVIAEVGPHRLQGAGVSRTNLHALPCLLEVDAGDRFRHGAHNLARRRKRRRMKIADLLKYAYRFSKLVIDATQDGMRVEPGGLEESNVSGQDPGSRQAAKLRLSKAIRVLG